MNKWIKKTYDLVENTSYLDSLQEVYPYEHHKEREIDNQIWNGFETLYNAKDRDPEAILIKSLEFELSPIKSGYYSLVKNRKNLIYNNPALKTLLIDDLLSQSLEEIYENISKPKEKNRTMGSHFQNYVKKCSFPENTIVLKESDAGLTKYAKAEFGYVGRKGLDFVAKKNGIHYYGEAKFLGTEGGSQKNQLKDALRFIRDDLPKTKPVAFIDGALWTKKSGLLYNELKHYLDCNIMSALLLEEFMSDQEGSSEVSSPFDIYLQ